MGQSSSEYHRNYYQQNKERILTKNRQYQKDNPERRRKWQQDWRDKNREALREKQKARLKNLDAFLARKLAHLKKTKIRAHSTEVRVLAFEIDVQHLLGLWAKQEGKCAISGYPMRFPESSLFALSVDRIDPAQGYVPGNVQLVCQGINFAKNRFTNAEMIEFWNFRDCPRDGTMAA